jgi:molybdopterin converting factor small subunit
LVAAPTLGAFSRYGRIPNMTDLSRAQSEGSDGAAVTVRYWAAARAAAGVESETYQVTGGTTLADLLGRVLDRHRDRPRLPDVLGVCSMLVGDRPVGSQDPAQVNLRPGDVVELLPPFAGG